MADASTPPWVGTVWAESGHGQAMKPITATIMRWKIGIGGRKPGLPGGRIAKRVLIAVRGARRNEANKSYR